MKFDIYFLKAVGAATIFYGLVFFIALRIFNNSNNMKRCIFSLIVGGTLISINALGLMIDYSLNGFHEVYIQETYPYFAFPIMAIVFTIVVPLVFLIIAKKYNQKIKSEFNHYSKKREEEQKAYDKEAKQTVVIDETKFLYLALKYEDKYLLKEVVNKEGINEYSGLIVKFASGDNFHDELLNKVVASLNLDVKDYFLTGKVMKKNGTDKPDAYYVYTINLNSISSTITDLVQVSPVVLYGYNLNNFNKQILFRAILKEYFEIEL